MGLESALNAGPALKGWALEIGRFDSAPRLREAGSEAVRALTIGLFESPKRQRGIRRYPSLALRAFKRPSGSSQLTLRYDSKSLPLSSQLPSHPRTEEESPVVGSLRCTLIIV
jgi:hypothetical protein